MLLERAGTVQSESRRPVTDLSSEYLHAISCSEDIRSQHTTEPAIWRPPTGACKNKKVNVDAAKLLSANAAGFGLIVGMVTVFIVLGAKTIRSLRHTSASMEAV